MAWRPGPGNWRGRRRTSWGGRVLESVRTPGRGPEPGWRGDSVARSKARPGRPWNGGRERPVGALSPENSPDRGPKSASVAQEPTSCGIAVPSDTDLLGEMACSKIDG